MTEPENAEHLSVDSDLGLASFSEAMKILNPKDAGHGTVEVMLAFGSGLFYIADEIDRSLMYTSGIMLTRHYHWQDYKEDEWSLTDRATGRIVWCRGA